MTSRYLHDMDEEEVNAVLHLLERNGNTTLMVTDYLYTWCFRYLPEDPGGTREFHSFRYLDAVVVSIQTMPSVITVNGKAFSGRGLRDAKSEVASLIRQSMLDCGMVVTF